MLGSTSGFLVHNFYPAKIFMGDSGSMFLGYIMSIITILGFKSVMMSSIIIPLFILVVPILDTLFAIIRRLLKGQDPFKADRKHLHHQLLGMNFSQRTTVLIIYAINILFALASIFYTLQDQTLGTIIYIIIFIIVLWFVLHTTIISDKTPEHTKKIRRKILPIRRKKNTKK